jgi:CheY-like chemotaxis protein
MGQFEPLQDTAKEKRGLFGFFRRSGAKLFSLPAAHRQEMTIDSPGTITQPITVIGRVLVVDDDKAIRTLAHFTLAGLGYEVMQAETALQGVNLYREKFEAGERFDAVILDLTLPGGMGGKEALQKLIEIDPTVNAIVSSGYATDAPISRYKGFGFRGVIAKPYEIAELGKIVHDVINSSHINLIPDCQIHAVD